MKLIRLKIFFFLLVFDLMNTAHIAAQPLQAPPAPLPSFDVASIKPNKSGDRRWIIRFPPGRFLGNGLTAKQLIAFAYGVKDFQISGGPSWITSDQYDIEAKEPEALAAELPKLSREEQSAKTHLLVQSLLADRFALKLTHTTKDLPVYALIVAKGGPKLNAATPGDTYPNGMKGPDGRGAGLMRVGRGEIEGQGVPLTLLVSMLSQQLGRTVLDQTGLKGKYDIQLKWTPDTGAGAMFQARPGGAPGAEQPPPSESTGPSIFTAIQEQLGLKLESTKGPVEVLVIDQIERPSEN